MRWFPNRPRADAESANVAVRSAERNAYLQQPAEALGERNEFLRQRDIALGERNEYLRQRDEALGEGNELRRQLDEALGERNELRRQLDEALGERNEFRRQLEQLRTKHAQHSKLETAVPDTPRSPQRSHFIATLPKSGRNSAKLRRNLLFSLYIMATLGLVHKAVHNRPANENGPASLPSRCSQAVGLRHEPYRSVIAALIRKSAVESSFMLPGSSAADCLL
jgi:hypothetical protein